MKQGKKIRFFLVKHKFINFLVFFGVSSLFLYFFASGIGIFTGEGIDWKNLQNTLLAIGGGIIAAIGFNILNDKWKKILTRIKTK